MRPRLGLVLAPLVALAALLATAGCGSSASSTAAQDPSASASPPTTGPSSPAGAQVHLTSLTGAGGQPGAAVPLNTPEQIARFTRQFRAPAMQHRIRAIAERVGTDGDVWGSVVMVGCDRPPGAAVQVGGSGTVTITPYDVESPLQECLAAVTTVAIAVVPQG